MKVVAKGVSMEDLTVRKYGHRPLMDWEDWHKEGKCAKCNNELKQWDGVFYGLVDDCCSVYDRELSYKTGYCKECAMAEAIRTRKLKFFTPPIVVSHTENIHDDGYLCERTVYADGSVVESTADSQKDAARWW